MKVYVEEIHFVVHRVQWYTNGAYLTLLIQDNASNVSNYLIMFVKVQEEKIEVTFSETKVSLTIDILIKTSFLH